MALAVILKDEVRQLRLASFLQRIEVAFLEENVRKLEGWITDENRNASMEVVRKISAVGAICK